MRWLAALALSASAAGAAVVSPRADSVGVTIYHEGHVSTEDLRNSGRGEGLGMIRETRTVELAAGDSEIQFRGVASTMVPQTAALDGLPDAPTERDFDYGLLSPASLIDKSLGQTVHLVTTNRKNRKVTDEPATIVSGPDGAVLKLATGGYQALGCSAMPERLVFDRVPEGLIDKPTLTVKVHVAQAGKYQVTLRYIATGLNWAAAYVARVNPDGRTLNLSGWLTLANFGETGFPAADVDVIAGHVQTTGDDTPPQVPHSWFFANCWEMNPSYWRHAMMGFAAPPPPPAPMMAMRAMDKLGEEQVVVTGSPIEARNFGDYKQYPLGEPTDMAAQQTKQIQFLDQPAVPFTRIYGARAPESDQADVTLPATIVLRAKNTQDAQLGKALPAGDVATMEGSDAMLTGQGQLDDTPVGLPLEIPAGETLTVTAQVRRLAERKFENIRKHTESDEEVTITNGNATPATFEWRQPLGEGASIVHESDRHGELHGDAMWRLALKPGEQRVIRYTINSPG